ncbi:MAG: YqgE/AlgH family protein [Acidimicrobiales bacterium]
MKRARPLRRGVLLVAAPHLPDFFHEAVVLLLEHSPEGGALGVVLNRPTELPIADALPRWSRLAAPPPHVYIGGPVDPAVAIGLIGLPSGVAPGGWAAVLDGLWLVDLDHDPDRLGAEAEGVRLYSGYAGWAPGQLEVELATDAWFVLPAEVGDVFASDPGQLWRRVLARQGGEYRMYANFPPDPSVN